jgi:hypothetical protein
MLQKDDAWLKLLFDYHKAILPTWDFGMGANWLKANSKVIVSIHDRYNSMMGTLPCIVPLCYSSPLMEKATTPIK